MVKIALQLSGRLRYTDASLLSLIGAMIEPLAPDIFCSFWQTENHDTMANYATCLTPKLFEIEDQKTIKPYIDQLFPYNIHTNLPSMSYKFHRVACIRRAYELSNNINYDVVIQARSDNLFFEKLDLNRCKLAVQKNAILCSNQEYNPIIDDYVLGTRMVDNFYLGPTVHMDQASQTFWRLQQKASEWTSKGWQHEVRIPEIIQTAIWQDLGIPIDGLPGIGASGNFFYEIDRTPTRWL